MKVHHRVVLSGSVLALVSLFSPGCGSPEETSNEPSTASGGQTSSGGNAGVGGGTASGGAPVVDPFLISEQDDTFVLEHGDVVMQIDPSHGGRITSFRVHGIEILVEEGAAAEFGSTFWPSPQDWAWPPTESIPELDSAPYSVIQGADHLELTSQENETVGAIVTKRFSAAQSSAGTLGIAVTYSIQNTNDGAAGFAAWEVSRVSPSGVVLYPEGPGGVLDHSTLQPTSAQGHGFYEFLGNEVQGDAPKIFADGAGGWVAWARTVPGLDGVLTIKSFPDVSMGQFAPGEAEIEIYADPTGDYVEVEQQGAYVANLEPGATLTWTVSWYAVALPSSVPISVGSQALIDAVNDAL